MFENAINQAYDATDATWEIIVMLLGAFLLGFLLKWAIQGGASSPKKEDAGKFSAFTNDDLKIVEGIGPKIEGLLKKSGITNWKELSKTKTAKLREVLSEGGDRFSMHDPSSWADQAALAEGGKWKELEDFQNLLVGGRG